MQLVSKEHTALRVIEGGKRRPHSYDSAIRLRKEEATSVPRKLSQEEIEALRHTSNPVKDTLT